MTETQQSTAQGESSDGVQGHDVFVSYSRNDRETVVRLTKALEDRGKRCWVDLQYIPPSAEWMAEIRGVTTVTLQGHQDP